MCTEIFYKDTEIYSLEQLMDKYTVYPEDVDLAEDETLESLGTCCLCGVDVEAILTRAKVDYEWDPFGYRIIYKEKED